MGSRVGQSYAGFTRVSIIVQQSFLKKMDCPVPATPTLPGRSLARPA
jgi:hypothetical protein